MGSLIAIGLPLLSTIIPLLFQKGASGRSGFAAIFERVKGLFGNITGSPTTTVVGASGSLTGILVAATDAFGCKVPLSDISTWLTLAAPLILGALLPGSTKAPVVAPATPPKA